MDLSCIYIYILWMRTPSSIDYVAFCFYNAIDNEAHRALGCSLYNPIVDKFPLLFQNVILGSMESIFRSDHRVNGRLYLMKDIALRSTLCVGMPHV